MNTIMKTSMIIWFILSATIKMNAQYSDVHCKQHPQSMQITQIDYREYSTIIHFKYINYFEGGGWMNIGENSYLKDKNTNKRYKLLNSINIPINSEGENRYMIFDSKDQIHYFSLEFEKLPDSTIEFDMVEDENNKDAFNFYGITLNPEVKKDFINIDDYIASTPVKEYGIYICCWQRPRTMRRSVTMDCSILFVILNACRSIRWILEKRIFPVKVGKPYRS